MKTCRNIQLCCSSCEAERRILIALLLLLLWRRRSRQPRRNAQPVLWGCPVPPRPALHGKVSPAEHPPTRMAGCRRVRAAIRSNGPRGGHFQDTGSKVHCMYTPVKSIRQDKYIETSVPTRDTKPDPSWWRGYKDRTSTSREAVSDR